MCSAVAAPATARKASIAIFGQHVGADESTGDAHAAVGRSAVGGVTGEHDPALRPGADADLGDLLGVEERAGPHPVDEALDLPARVGEAAGPERLLLLDRAAVDRREFR